MTSLFRNSRSIITRFSSIRRTAATTGTGTQAKTSGASTNLSQLSRSGDGAAMAVRDARQRLTPTDPIKPRAAGETPFIPLVGTTLNAWGKMGFGIILGLSAYFVYINYITNPEFYKSLKLSREASKRSSYEQPANREGTLGHKIDDANTPKGELNKHL
ncbi:unnamed protein product [Rotaria sp. Silwood1]|nr:unnamed protein product [Rotaria sp. Silwood1]CAF1500629.1 unnamed protein product [Rotaria sp. Silwood1]CAF1525224.1 unnamed protein product [Rotaria sp. Silwood1]CAF3642363.1 unnamed protein product [Rotaria sp. Silwood1]CAF3649491.1 unnamed protein product [Rotaria sp. Silwood1]